MLEGKKLVIKTADEMPAFEPIPADKYTCQIVDVNAVEQVNNFKGGISETRLNYQFVILDPKKEDDKLHSLRGRYLWKRTSLSLHEKSWLAKLAKAVYGRELTKDEQKNFDPESLVGKRVDVMVEQSPSKDGTRIYANVISFTKASEKSPIDGKPFEPFDFEAAKAKSAERAERSSSPVVAPKEQDPFIVEMEADKAKMVKEMEENTVSKEDVDAIFGTGKAKK